MIKAILENALVNQAIAEVLNEHENDWLNNGSGTKVGD